MVRWLTGWQEEIACCVRAPQPLTPSLASSSATRFSSASARSVAVTRKRFQRLDLIPPGEVHVCDKTLHSRLEQGFCLVVGRLGHTRSAPAMNREKIIREGFFVCMSLGLRYRPR